MRQSEHKDSAFDHPKCPYYFIANVPLCDFTVENGATEFWLGSHAQTTVKDQQTLQEDEMVSMKLYKAGQHIPWITEEAKQARRAVRPPMQPEARCGDIMIRDLRTWHAGMPNHSDKHRIMLGLGYQVRISGMVPYNKILTSSLRAPFTRITWPVFTYLCRSRSSSWALPKAEWRSEPTFTMTRSLQRPRRIRTLTFALSTEMINALDHIGVL